MKITFVCAVVSQGGGSRVTAMHAKKLLEMGHDVHVVSKEYPKFATTPKQLWRLIRGRTKRPDPDRTRYFDAFGDRHIILPFEKAMMPEDLPDADVIIATWWKTAFWVRDLPASKGRKVHFVQGHEVYDHLPTESTEVYRMPFAKIVVSDWLARIMEETYDDKSVKKVLNAVDTAHFDALSRSMNECPILGFMYSQGAYKGVDVAIRAIEVARRDIPDLKVLVFGKVSPGPDAPLPPGTDFHLLPSQEEIPRLYAACDAWLFPSRLEGFGLPILEAMACRTPVMATRAGAAPDLIEDGVNGRLVDVDDAEALGRAVADTLSLPPAEWRAMSDAAHETAHGYTWDDAAREFEAALKEILARDQ